MVYQKLLQEINGDLGRVEAELFKSAGNSGTILGETSVHLLQAGGKRLRPAFIILAGKMFNARPEKMISLAAAIELIHMASLVHDDVIDCSVRRRGRPTVAAQWGRQIAVETGDYLFAQALALVARYQNEDITSLLARISLQMCEGEIEQIGSIGQLDQNLRDYLRRIKRKTALLISACCSLGAIIARAPATDIRRLGRFGYYLGMAFQLTDDNLDFVGKESVTGKPVGNDLRQGIITLPVIYTLRHPVAGPQLYKLLRQSKKGEEDWLQAVELIKDSGALERTGELTESYLAKAREQLVYLPKGRVRRLFTGITDFIAGREF